MYIGQPYDTAIGLYYIGARYYDPTTGRFITRDPAPGTDSDPLSLNAYIYARDNPVAFTDSTSRSWNVWTSVEVGVIIGLAIGAAPLTGGLSIAGAGALVGGFLAENAASFAANVAIGGAINVGLNGAMNGGRVSTGDVAFGFGLAAFGVVAEGGEGEEQAPLPEQLQSEATGSADGRSQKAKFQLANNLGGNMEVTVLTGDTDLGVRRYDVLADRTAAEMKFGGDPINYKQLNKDIHLSVMGALS
jgi:RHS repeat-associated protein